MHFRFLTTIVLGFSIAVLSCGDPTDEPEDCSEAEYFDTGDRLCKTCPAVVEPECREGCGFVITDDDRGCPVSECDLVCEDVE